MPDYRVKYRTKLYKYDSDRDRWTQSGGWKSPFEIIPDLTADTVDIGGVLCRKFKSGIDAIREDCIEPLGGNPPPPPVDAVVSAWSAWFSTSEWTPCVNGQHARNERRERSIISPALNGGKTPPLVETRVNVEACGVNPPPSPAGAITLTVKPSRFGVGLYARPDFASAEVRRLIGGESFAVDPVWTATGSGMYYRVVSPEVDAGKYIYAGVHTMIEVRL